MGVGGGVGEGKSELHADWVIREVVFIFSMSKRHSMRMKTEAFQTLNHMKSTKYSTLAGDRVYKMFPSEPM